MQQRDGFALIGQLAGVDAVDDHAGVPGAEGSRVAAEEEELAGRQARAVGEGEVDAIEDGPAEVERVGAGILEFEEFKFIAGCRADAGRIVHDFGDEQTAEVLRGIERGFGNRAPSRADADAGADRDREVDQDGSAGSVGDGRG